MGLKIDWEGALGLVIRKSITLLIVLLLVLTIEFLFFRVGVGTESYMRGEMPPEQAALLEEKLHANESIPVQYLYFIGDMLTGKGSFDLYSYSAHRPVADVIDDSFWLTLLLFGTALVLSLLLGLLCAYALWRSRSRTGRAVGSASLLLLWTAPVVLVTLFFLLQVVFRFNIGWAFQHIVDY
jgi:peptide/nickel transport system permease protein